jgi:hypothetical protein
MKVVIRVLSPASLLSPAFAVAAFVMAIGLTAPLRAQETPAAAPPQQDRRDPAPEPRPYERVITKDAKSDDGIFTVHRIGDRIYYEIPQAMFDKEFLWSVRLREPRWASAGVARPPATAWYGGNVVAIACFFATSRMT